MLYTRFSGYRRIPMDSSLEDTSKLRWRALCSGLEQVDCFHFLEYHICIADHVNGGTSKTCNPESFHIGSDQISSRRKMFGGYRNIPRTHDERFNGTRRCRYPHFNPKALFAPRADLTLHLSSSWEICGRMSRSSAKELKPKYNLIEVTICIRCR